MKGVAVVYVGEDLDVLLELCDRILVLCGGQVSGIVDAASATKDQIGLLMTHSMKKKSFRPNKNTSKKKLARRKKEASRNNAGKTKQGGTFK